MFQRSLRAFGSARRNMIAPLRSTRWPFVRIVEVRNEAFRADRPAGRSRRRQFPHPQAGQAGRLSPSQSLPAAGAPGGGCSRRPVDHHLASAGWPAAAAMAGTSNIGDVVLYRPPTVPRRSRTVTRPATDRGRCAPPYGYHSARCRICFQYMANNCRIRMPLPPDGIHIVGRASVYCDPCTAMTWKAIFWPRL